jgi:cell division protein FtsB
VIATTIGVFSIVPSLFEFLYFIFRTEALISSVTVVVFFSLLLLIFYLHIKVDELTVKVAKLAAEVSALQYDPEYKERDKRSNK